MQSNCILPDLSPQLGDGRVASRAESGERWDQWWDLGSILGSGGIEAPDLAACSLMLDG